MKDETQIVITQAFPANSFTQDEDLMLRHQIRLIVQRSGVQPSRAIKILEDECHFLREDTLGLLDHQGVPMEPLDV